MTSDVRVNMIVRAWPSSEPYRLERDVALAELLNKPRYY